MENIVTAISRHAARSAFVVPSPLGKIWLCADTTDDAGESLNGLYFEAQNHFPDNLAEQGADQQKPPVIARAQAQLQAYFDGSLKDFDVPISWYGGSAFQRDVWQALLEIPFGATWSYGRLARHMGLSSGHARAVGSAVGRNPLTIIVPCHRVIGSAGAMTGYAGGIDRKRDLLRRELPAPPLFADLSGQAELFPS